MQRYAILRSLVEPAKRDLGATCHRLAELLADAGEQGTVQLNVREGEAEHVYSFELGQKQAVNRAVAGPRPPTLQIVTAAETWWPIAEGRLSPLEAFAQGKLRVRGDTALGTRLVRKLAAGAGMVEICGLESEG